MASISGSPIAARLVRAPASQLGAGPSSDLQARIVAGAMADVNRRMTYSQAPRYQDAQGLTGCCADLACDAYEAGGFDLMGAIAQDASANPQHYASIPESWRGGRNAEAMRLYFQSCQTLVPPTAPAQPGDTIYFNWSGGKTADHVAIVTQVDAQGHVLEFAEAANPKAGTLVSKVGSVDPKAILGFGRLKGTTAASPRAAAAPDTAPAPTPGPTSSTPYATSQPVGILAAIGSLFSQVWSWVVSLFQGTSAAAAAATPVSAAQQRALQAPNAAFISQMVSSYNPKGPAWSMNCGPTSLAMAIRYFGKTLPGGNPADPEQMIEAVRKAMTGADNIYDGTGPDTLIKGAQAAGLKAYQLPSTVQDVDRALAQGQMVIATGNPISWEKGENLTSDQYANGARWSGAHYVLVVGKVGDRYLVCDPLSKQGAMQVSRQELDGYFSFYHHVAGGIAVGA